MAMFLSKAVNIPSQKVILKKEDLGYTGVISSDKLSLNKEYLLYLFFDLSNKKYKPSDEFLENFRVNLSLLTYDGTEIPLSRDCIEIKKEDKGDGLFVSVNFCTEINPTYFERVGMEDLSISSFVNFEKLAITIYSLVRKSTECFDYSVEVLSEKIHGNSQESIEFTFEPGIIIGEDLPFTKEDFENQKEDVTKKEEHFLEHEQKDAVNNPSHYNDSEIETFEMFLLMNHNNPDMIKGALLFNIFKYRDREKLKGNPEQDKKKMMWYLDQFTTLFPEEAHLYEIYHQLKVSEGK